MNRATYPRSGPYRAVVSVPISTQPRRRLQDGAPSAQVPHSKGPNGIRRRCGSATVAVALHELLEESSSEARIAYVGMDHNVAAIEIGRALLAAPGLGRPDFGTTLSTDLTDARMHFEDGVAERTPLLLSASYLLRQNALSVDDVGAIAETLTLAASQALESGAAVVPLLITDAVYGPESRFESLLKRLRQQMDVSGDTTPDVFSVSLRFPNLYPDIEGWFVERSRTNNVESWLMGIRAR